MAWIYLVIAGLCEVVWAVGIKYTDGFTRLWPSVFTLGWMGVSFYLLGHAVRTLPVGAAYAIWTGIGAVGVAIYGMIHLGDSTDWRRVLCIFIIVIGILGLKLLSPASS